MVAGAVCALAAGAAQRTQPETITAPRRETICNRDTPRFPSCWRHLGMRIIQNQGTVMGPARNRFDLVADHPAMAVQIAHTVRIDAATSGVDRLSPLVAGDHVFLAANPARIPVTVETAPVGNRNCERGLPACDGSKRHRRCADDQ